MPTKRSQQARFRAYQAMKSSQTNGLPAIAWQQWHSIDEETKQLVTEVQKNAQRLVRLTKRSGRNGCARNDKIRGDAIDNRAGLVGSHCRKVASWQC